MKRAALSAPLLLALACTPPPERTLDAYLAAVKARRYDAAYALLSADYRRTHDLARFTRELGVLPAPQHGPTRVEYRAEIAAQGARIPLVLEGGRWRLAEDPLELYPQATPEEALRSFLRAVANRRYDVLLGFVPARYRTVVTGEKLKARWEGPERAHLESQLAAVRRHLGERFELSPDGDEARLPLGELKAVRLVREESRWRVLDLE